MKHGVLLINLGTPDKASHSSVKKYLKEFLADKYVIDLPFISRYLLLYGVILPFRTKKTTHAYQKIWTQDGSPLLYHSQNLCHKLQNYLGCNYRVALGMRYGNPSIQSALHELNECSEITVVPLYPQYAAATTDSSIVHTFKTLKKFKYKAKLTIIPEFYNNEHYITAQAEAIKPFIASHDHILFSYHGLPERQLNKIGCNPICKTSCSSNRRCYRLQCLQTTNLLIEKLGIDPSRYSSSFQSRLGKTPWIKPYTDEMLEILAKRGIKSIAITCPSFVSDCLETLEEIAIQAKEQWLELGGERLTLIPAINSNDIWVSALSKIINL